MVSETERQLRGLLKERILLLDGAMGTMIQSYGLQEADYRGDRFAGHGCDLKGNNDLLTLTQPGIIRDIHTAFLDAGADIICTNTLPVPLECRLPNMTVLSVAPLLGEVILRAHAGRSVGELFDE